MAMISMSPRYTAPMKSIVIILLVAIVATLASGLFYMSGKHHDSEKLQRALRLRVALSAILIAILVGGYFLGWLDP